MKISPTRNISLERSICIIDPKQLLEPYPSEKLSIPAPVCVETFSLISIYDSVDAF
jgi:hypothetical protein